MAYSLSTALAIYFVIWWIVLFVTLPFGVRSQHEDGEGAPGTDPGAPIMARMGWKLLWTTLISGVVFGIGIGQNVAQRHSSIFAACIDRRPGCRDGSISHGGDQLPDGLRCQSGKLRGRAAEH